jgi:hypothetical protein
MFTNAIKSMFSRAAYRLPKVMLGEGEKPCCKSID